MSKLVYLDEILATTAISFADLGDIKQNIEFQEKIKKLPQIDGDFTMAEMAKKIQDYCRSQGSCDECSLNAKEGKRLFTCTVSDPLRWRLEEENEI